VVEIDERPLAGAEHRDVAAHDRELAAHVDPVDLRAGHPAHGRAAGERQAEMLALDAAGEAVDVL
jgi:hypothetical protein